MFGSDVIDAAIGLFLVFFLFSLLCSAINEWIVGHFGNHRSKMLEQGIRRMLPDKAFADKFFAHPLISALSEKPKKKPSYISNDTFVDGLLAVLEETFKADPAKTKLDNLKGALSAMASEFKETARVIQGLVGTADDYADVRKKLGNWFDNSMERIGGVYKRKTQLWMILWATLLTFAFNIDSFEIAKVLLNDSKLRAALVASAEETVRQPVATNSPAAGSNTVAAIEKKITDLQLPIGWLTFSNQTTTNQSSITSIVTQKINNYISYLRTTSLRPGQFFTMRCFGWLVTAGALSFGAPFWFDLLGKLVNLRAAGKKPEAAKPPDPKK